MTAPVMSWKADCGQDLICRRCYIPGRGWTWDGQLFCEPCHRATRGDDHTDQLILADYASFGEWWTEEFLQRVDHAAISVQVP